MASQDGAIVCPNCKIRNPKSRKTCVNCGFNFRNGGVAPTTNQTMQTPLALSKPPSSFPATPKSSAPEKSKIYCPQEKDSGIIPGRPAWLTAYAILLGSTGIGVVIWLGLLAIAGSLLITYDSYFLPLANIIVGISAIAAALGLWELKKFGRILTIILQLLWMTAAAIGLVIIINAVPKITDRDNLLLTMVFIGMILLVIVIAILRAAFAPTIMGQLLNPERTGAVSRLVIGSLVLLSGVFAAAAILLLDPHIISRLDINTFWPGTLLDGLILSIPINGLILFGLYAERERFT